MIDGAFVKAAGADQKMDKQEVGRVSAVATALAFLLSVLCSQG
jgi:hypothetical protein